MTEGPTGRLERFCQNCGYEHGGNAKFCPQCGAAQDPPQPETQEHTQRNQSTSQPGLHIAPTGIPETGRIPTPNVPNAPPYPPMQPMQPVQAQERGVGWKSFAIVFG